MPDDSVQIQFGAKIDELVSGMENLSSAMQDQLGKMNDSLQGMADQSKKTAEDLKASNEQTAASFKSLETTVGGAFTGIEATIAGLMGGMKSLLGIVAGGALFKSAVDSTIQWDEECAKLSRTLGITMESASVLNTGLRMVGTSADTYTGALIKLERQLKSNEEGLQELGLVTRDANGQLVDGETAMKNAIATIQQYKVGQDQNTIAIQMFGRGMQQIAPLMRLNDEIMTRAAQTADRLGLKIGTENVEAAHKYEVELNSFKLVLTSIEQKIGAEVIPMLDQLAFYLNSAGPAAASATVEAIKIVIGVLDALTSALRVSSSAVAAWAGTIYAGLSRLPGMVSSVLDKMDLKGEQWGLLPESTKNLPRALEAINADIAAQQKGLSETIDTIWADTGNKIVDTMKGSYDRLKGLQIGAPAELPKYGGMDQVFGQGGSKSAPDPALAGAAESGKDLVAQYEAELEKLKNSQADLNAWSATQDYAFWNTKLAAAKQGSETWQEIWNKMANIYRQLTAEQQAELKKQADNEIQTAQNVAAMKKVDADSEIKMATEKYNTLFALGQINATQRQQLETQAYQKQYAEALTAYYQELALLQKQGDETIAKQSSVYLQMEKLQQEYLQKTQKANDQALITMKQQWDNYANQVGSALTSMLFHHQTMLQTMQSLTERAFNYLIEVLLKKLVSAWITNEAAKTAATTAGVTTRTAAETAGATSGMLAQAAAAIRSIFTSAAETFAGIFAFLSPVMGPAAAGPAAAGQAEVTAAAGEVAFAAGGFDVPENTFAMLHKKEMVLPANLADNVRNMTGKGGDLHLHIMANDSKSFTDQLRDSGSTLNEMIRQAFRDFHLRPK